jgi:hypothetical protein
VEKLHYVLWRPSTVAPHTWSERLLALPKTLAASGAQRVKIAVPDVPIPDEDPYPAMRATAPSGFVSFWLNTASQRAAPEALVRATAERIAGYAVQESTVLPNTMPATGTREEGFLQVCGFAALPGLSRAALWDAWLGDHSIVAVETQQTSLYVQNIVVRPLTEGAPAWDAIVEERFPAAALNDRAVYFDAVGDPARQQANMDRMAASCARFIDFTTITLMNCGEYRFGGWADPPLPTG